MPFMHKFAHGRSTHIGTHDRAFGAGRSCMSMRAGLLSRYEHCVRSVSRAARLPGSGMACDLCRG